MRKIVIYTDGSCGPTNPGPGGWAAILKFPESCVILQGNRRRTTNNQMELEAAISALAYLLARLGQCEVDLHTDSKYVKLGITRWIAKWERNGWQTATKKPVKNQAYWRDLRQFSQRHQVHWHWVKGHSQNRLNAQVDALAREAREGRIG